MPSEVIFILVSCALFSKVPWKGNSLTCRSLMAVLESFCPGLGPVQSVEGTRRLRGSMCEEPSAAFATMPQYCSLFRPLCPDVALAPQAWIDVSGSSARDVARQLREQQLMMPGAALRLAVRFLMAVA